jgi:trigger factor
LSYTREGRAAYRGPAEQGYRRRLGWGRRERHRYTRLSVKSTVEVLEDNKVKVSVEVDEAEFEAEVDAAFKRISKEVRLPGFRPGKAPRRILEAKFGSGLGREEALRESLPSYYTRAVIEHDVDVIAPPDIEITEGRDAGAVTFDAVVAVRPSINISGYDSLRVEIESPVPDDDAIQQQLDRLRNQFAELEVVERPAADGDHVSIDIAGSLDGEPIPGLTAEDYLYEVGSGAVVAEIDENLRGASAGEVLEFTATHPDPDEDRELEFEVTVKEVKQKVLPEVDDEFARQASEFETAAELRADIEKRLTSLRQAQARFALRQKTQEALADLVGDDIPEAMVANEMQGRLEDLAQRLRQQGVSLDQYFGASGRTAEEITSELREGATQSVKVDLALRAVAAAEALEVTDQDLDDELATFAGQVNQDIEIIRARFRDGGQLSGIRSGLQKGKALDWLLDHVEIVDEHGAVIDRASLEADDSDAKDSDAKDSAPKDSAAKDDADEAVVDEVRATEAASDDAGDAVDTESTAEGNSE